MKVKPDISRFARLAKDPTAFLEGALVDRLEKPNAPAASVPTSPPALEGEAGPSSPSASSAPPVPPSPAAKPEPTVQKLFRLRWDTVNALRDAAAQESRSQGKRVTETEIVETLLRSHLKLDS
jgi:hypothetical protein